MLDAALISKCADPSLTPAIVEKFVDAAGSLDPLAITVNSGGRRILVPKSKTVDEAMEVVRQNVGRANVRVGLTQLPAGFGVTNASELKSDLVDACENLSTGTKIFARLLRIVARWYGNPAGKEAELQIFEDAVYSWKTGRFEGVEVFRANDSDIGWQAPAVSDKTEQGLQEDPGQNNAMGSAEQSTAAESENAEIRVDLSRIHGK